MDELEGRMTWEWHDQEGGGSEPFASREEAIAAIPVDMAGAFIVRCLGQYDPWGGELTEEEGYVINSRYVPEEDD